MTQWRLWLLGFLFFTAQIDAHISMTTVTMQHQTTLSIEHLRCLQSALLELDKKSLNSDNYQASLYTTDNGYRVIFADKAEPLSSRGSVVAPSLEVVLDAQCHVVTVHFSR